MAAVHEVALPPAARELCTLDRVDYHDSFVAETGPVRDLTGEEWARTMLEGAPPATRHALYAGWLSLGLKLGPSRPEDHVLGWELRRSDPGLALLGRDSRVGMPAELLFRVQADGLFFATFIRHDNPAMRLTWAGIAAPHRRVVHRLLTQAVARAEERGVS